MTNAPIKPLVWTDHEADGCPVSTSAFVDVRYRDGDFSMCVAAGGLPWSKTGTYCDIVAFRVVPPPNVKSTAADDIKAAYFEGFSAGCDRGEQTAKQYAEKNWPFSQAQSDHERTLMDAASALSVAPVAVSVKGLEWDETDERWWGAQPFHGFCYEIRVTDRGGTRVRWPENGGWEAFDGTLEAAKAAAQSDFNARIRWQANWDANVQEMSEKFRAVNLAQVMAGTNLDLLARAEAAESQLEMARKALDVADRLIERGYGLDTPKEWHAAYRSIAARALAEGETK